MKAKSYLPRLVSLPMLAGAALFVPSLALALVSHGDTVGKSEAEIRESLSKSGYEVQSIEIERGEIEVNAVLDGKSFEIEIDPSTGLVTEVEADDDDDEEDSD